MSEVIYKYVKGKGWVPERTRPNNDTDYNMDDICALCNRRRGNHWGFKQYCMRGNSPLATDQTFVD